MGKILKKRDLIKRGFSEWKLLKLRHMEGSPFYQICKRGGWEVDSDKLDIFLDKLAANKEVYQ